MQSFNDTPKPCNAPFLPKFLWNCPQNVAFMTKLGIQYADDLEKKKSDILDQPIGWDYYRIIIPENWEYRMEEMGCDKMFHIYNEEKKMVLRACCMADYGRVRRAWIFNNQ
jgi:hypothetical protein